MHQKDMLFQRLCNLSRFRDQARLDQLSPVEDLAAVRCFDASDDLAGQQRYSPLVFAGDCMLHLVKESLCSI